MTNSELKERLTDTIALLSIPGVGKARFRKLVEKFGSPSAALEAPASELESLPGISRKVASAIRECADIDEARRVAARVVQLGWAALFPGEPEFPTSLTQIPDPPALIFRMGAPISADEKLIGIVGTRHATEAGRRFTYKLAGDLAKAGITVVSGMAEGIDSYAHQGAIDAGGQTIAVWGTSLDIVYPLLNRQLAEQIVQHGAVYSEYLPDTGPDRAFFPERNRIISGLSEGVIVVEAGEKSGALITAQHALEQGKELFAVPGPPDAERSRGANRLIAGGARLLTSVDDIFDELPRLKGQVAARQFTRRADITDSEQKLVTLLGDGPLQVDELGRLASLSVSEIMELLLALELKGVVQELSGKRYVLSQ